LPDFYSFDPCTDPRWPVFLDRHPAASVFHSAGWLEALRRTYGYKPIAYTGSRPGADLVEGFPFCRVSTWISGRRLISVPFSDHAALLTDDGDALRELFSFLSRQLETKACRYVEIRPVTSRNVFPSMLGQSAAFYWHRLSLERDLSALYASFHKTCVRRKIRRAEREGLICVEGGSEKLVQHFYGLLLATHRRHGLPPQPIAWYRNLLDCLGDSIKISVAYKGDIAVAGMVTLTYKKTMTYKYGCSDSRYHNLGGMILLFWRAIQDAKTSGLEEFDMGRSDCDDVGLIRFKENWNADRSTLLYWGCPAQLRLDPSMWQFKAARKLIGALPKAVLPLVGRLSYRHLA
jgi:CelD/BcsL family acetyltransferase involved in cellulose biosynthesis